MGFESRTLQKGTPVLYLDIDGTVRKGKDEIGIFVNKKEDVFVFGEVPNILKKYKENGWRIVGISNQGGIALGILNYKDCLDAMIETQKQCFGLFDKIAFCVHHPDSKEKEMAICWCRKPRIGLIIESALSLGRDYEEFYPPHLALFVGDRPEDEECAKNANIKFMKASDWRKTGYIY